MSINFEGSTIHKGFILENTIEISEKLILLTGFNGAGKTRLLESIVNKSTKVTIDGANLDTNDIKYFTHKELIPQFGESYVDLKYETLVSSSIQFYSTVKKDFDSALNYDKVNIYNRRGSGFNNDDGTNYEKLYKMCNRIAARLNKMPSELTDDDIILNFELYQSDVLGVQNLGKIFVGYIKRTHRNKYYKWLHEDGEDVHYFNDDEFIEQFGSKPWLLMNSILNEVFDGKFRFSIPDEKSRGYSYVISLLENDKVVDVSCLSSGEKTLLWLALILFSSQYCDVEIANAPKLILIDEPDAFLHPKMVLKLYKVLNLFNEKFNSIIVFSTHSPTTVALSPSENIFLVENNSIKCVDKDFAISELLDGVTQISLNPKNRRQVFVESSYDAEIYQSIYSRVANSSDIIDPKISLSFVSSGNKISKDLLAGKLRQILKITDVDKVSEFVESVNGVGNYVQVIGQVESLIDNGNKTVRGIIDWDLENSPSDSISVLAKNYARTIENVTLDPIGILLLLHIHKAMPMSEICGEIVDWNNWVGNNVLLQLSVDKFILKILGRENERNAKLTYFSGVELLTDKEYLEMDGHNLEKIVKSKYNGLLDFCKNGKDGLLKLAIVQKSMITLTCGNFIPKVYEQVLADVQK